MEISGIRQLNSILGPVIKVYSAMGGSKDEKDKEKDKEKESIKRTIVFCGTKAEASEIGLIPGLKETCGVLHGDIPQVIILVNRIDFPPSNLPSSSILRY